MGVAHDGTATSSNGNIITKTGAGNYTYNSLSNNSLQFVTNPAGDQRPPSVISTNSQSISYTSFQQPSIITEGSYKLAYTYGGEYNRIKSVLTDNSDGSVETKYYFGDYEKQMKDSANKHCIILGLVMGLVQ